MTGEVLTLGKILIIAEQIANTFIVISVLVVISFIIYAGIKMATAKGNETEFKKGKDMLVNALIGGVVIFGVGIIVNTIANLGTNPSSIIR